MMSVDGFGVGDVEDVDAVTTAAVGVVDTSARPLTLRLSAVLSNEASLS